MRIAKLQADLFKAQGGFYKHYKVSKLLAALNKQRKASPQIIKARFSPVKAKANR